MSMSRVKRTKDIPHTFETPRDLSIEKRALRLRLQPRRRKAPPSPLPSWCRRSEIQNLTECVGHFVGTAAMDDSSSLLGPFFCVLRASWWLVLRSDRTLIPANDRFSWGSNFVHLLDLASRQTSATAVSSSVLVGIPTTTLLRSVLSPFSFRLSRLAAQLARDHFQVPNLCEEDLCVGSRLFSCFA